jgi:sterol 3beta-glucosyltransferase
MQITILALGSRGDVQPYVALGQGLRQAGHRVCLATQANFETFASGYGLDFAAIAPDSQQLMGGPTGRAMMTTGQNMPAFLFKLARLVQSYAQQTLRLAWQACQGADAVVCNAIAPLGYYLAEKLNIPAFGAWIYPLSRTRAFPAMGTPHWLQLGGAFNRLTYLVQEKITAYAFRQIFNTWRQTLQLPSFPAAGFYPYLYQKQIPILYAFSPTVLPKPGDWPEQAVVTGYWFLDHPHNWQPPTALMDFLQAGSPPVYVGFGSVSSQNSVELVDWVEQALKQVGQRGVLATGWGGLASSLRNQPLSSDIFVTDNIPHDWLFPHMAAVIHHGGAGTTAAGLRAGVPSIIIPFAGDQSFWGQRVVQLGAGPTPIPLKKLSVARLATAIGAAINNKPMQDRTTELGRQIRAETGVANAVEALERFLSRLA